MVSSIAAADVNRDGLPDLFVGVTSGLANGAGGAVILLNDSRGSFTAGSSRPFLRGLGSLLPAADFNGDGNLDLAVAISGISNFGVAVSLGSNSGTFAEPLYAINANGLDLYALTTIQVSDIDGDARPDVTLTTSGGVVVTFPSRGDGTFAPYRSQRISAQSDFTLPIFNSMVSADSNGDGLFDLVAYDSRE